MQLLLIDYSDTKKNCCKYLLNISTDIEFNVKISYYYMQGNT